MDFLSLTDAVLDPSPVELLLRDGEEEASGSEGVASPSADSGVSDTLCDDELLAELFPSDFLISANKALEHSPISMLCPQPVRYEEPTAALSPTPPVTERNKKNAEAARQNRIKKKAYVEGLERERAGLKAENLVYKTKCTELKATVRKLDREAQYLRSVLANQSVLASLIENIPDVEGVKLSSSCLGSRKRPLAKSDEGTPSSRPKKGRRDPPAPATSGGICLHVAKDVVSIEFCANCSQQAATQS